MGAVLTEVRHYGLMWVLATHLGSSRRAAGTLNRWAILHVWFTQCLPASCSLEVIHSLPLRLFRSGLRRTITPFPLCSSKLEFGKLLGCESPNPCTCSILKLSYINFEVQPSLRILSLQNFLFPGRLALPLPNQQSLLLNALPVPFIFPPPHSPHSGQLPRCLWAFSQLSHLLCPHWFQSLLQPIHYFKYFLPQ